MTKEEAEIILARNPTISALLNGLHDDGLTEKMDKFWLPGDVQDPRDANLNWLNVIRAARPKVEPTPD